MDDSGVTLSPPSTLEPDDSDSPSAVRGEPFRRSLLPDLNAASAHPTTATEPDDFDKFRETDHASLSSCEGELQGLPGRPSATVQESHIPLGARIEPLDDVHGVDEVGILNQEWARMRAEIQKLRELNVQKANLLTHKEALLQESESRARKVQQHYEHLLQEQLATNVEQVQERLSISERLARDQSLEIARLQAEAARVHRLEAEVEERATMEAELTTLLHEKIAECVQFQQGHYAAAEALALAQSSLQAAVQQRDRLLVDLERVRVWLQERDLLDEVRQHLQTVPSPAAHPPDAEYSQLRDERAALEAEVADLRGRVSQGNVNGPPVTELQSLRALYCELQAERDRWLKDKSALQLEVAQLRRRLEAGLGAGDAATSEGEVAWRKECVELRQRLQEQEEVELRLKQRFEQEVAQLSQKLMAEKHAFEQQKDAQLRRLMAENAQLRALLRESGGLADSGQWGSVQTMVDTLQRMVAQQQVYESPPSAPASLSSPPSWAAGPAPLPPLPGEEAETGFDTGRSSDLTGRSSIGSGPSASPRLLEAPRSDGRRPPPGYPRPTAGAAAAPGGPNGAGPRRRLPSFPPRAATGGAARRPPSAGAARESTPPGQASRHSSPGAVNGRYGSPGRSLAAAPAAGAGAGGRAGRAGSAALRSTSAPQRAAGPPTTALAPPGVARLRDGDGPAPPGGAGGSPGRSGPVGRPPVSAGPTLQLAGTGLYPAGDRPSLAGTTMLTRLGERSLATVLKRGSATPAPPGAPTPAGAARHPTPTQLDRRRAGSAPQMAAPAGGRAPAASPRGTAVVRAPKPPNLPRHLQ